MPAWTSSFSERSAQAWALILGNIVAYVTLKKQIAEVFFVGDSFSLISTYDILFKEPHRSFPIHLANPTRNADLIQLHYEDQIIMLKREDWDEFELIWNWLTSANRVTYTVTSPTSEPEEK